MICGKNRDTSLTAYLLREAIGCNELEGLHLSKVRGVAQHVYVHKLCNIAVPVRGVLVFKSISQGSAFLGNDSSFFGCSLALSHGPDQLPTQLVQVQLD